MLARANNETKATLYADLPHALDYPSDDNVVALEVPLNACAHDVPEGRLRPRSEGQQCGELAGSQQLLA